MVKSKRKKLILKAIFLIALFLGSCIIAELSFAQNVSSVELINNAKQQDNQKVVYRGEVIGDLMKRGDFSWVNLHDGINALGIWVDSSLLKDVSFVGNYKAYGDILEVEGIFHRSCKEHGGDLDIHAQVVRKVCSGSKITEATDVNKRNFVFILLGVLCLVIILNQLKTK